jgi:hypothetical protein
MHEVPLSIEASEANASRKLHSFAYFQTSISARVARRVRNWLRLAKRGRMAASGSEGIFTV